MTNTDIKTQVLSIFEKEFEIKNPGMDEDLRDTYGFDSIDAITLLGEIEKKILGYSISQEDKKRAMEIRTLTHICSYIESLQPS